jgi:23S rRNA (uracil1939-C5)-methyltransferase
MADTVNKSKSRCPVSKKCGGCTMINVPYEEQVAKKQQRVEDLIGRYGRVDPIVRMKNPDHYRNKVTSVFAPDKKGKPVCGIYKAGTHEVVPVKACMLEDLRADRIIQTVFALMESFKIRVYDEDRRTGFLRYVQVRTARGTRQVMVTLVTAEAVFPQAKKFVNALVKRHPEITTVVQNINDKQTTMVLGEKEKVLHGPGYIEDVLCKKRFRISSRSFYQVNSLQTEKLYNIALDYAGFSGKERILDAYCGIGTIGIIASDRCKEVLSVELNPEAVKDARINVKLNNAQNVEVFRNDSGRFMKDMAAKNEKLDILFMDPPRSGASEEFIEAVLTLRPAKVVYVSCEPDTLARDLALLTEGGYAMKKAVPVDMFPYTEGVETVVLLTQTK